MANSKKWGLFKPKISIWACMMPLVPEFGGLSKVLGTIRCVQSAIFTPILVLEIWPPEAAGSIVLKLPGL